MWDAIRGTRSLWSGGTRVAMALAIVAGGNLLAVTVVPAMLGYPHGGGFLLTALPWMSVAQSVAAALTLPLVVASRARVGLASALFAALSLTAFAAIDAYLWALCVASV